jgi:protein-disulfide isomerase
MREIERSSTDSVRVVATAPSRGVSLTFALLCSLGVAVSVELTRIHMFVHTDPTYHSVCAMSEGINCETVAVSPYSVFAGLPVSVWGIAAYLVMGAFALWGCSKARPHPAWPFGILLSLATFSVLTSAVLAFISATRINSLCIFCMGSYVINAGLLVVCIVARRQSRVRAVDLLALDVKALVARPALAAILVLAGVVALAALQRQVPAYWKTPGWTELPKLDSGTDDQGHHWIGARAAKLTIVEFSDYECPHCRAAHKEIRVGAARHPDRIRLVHRHLPLDTACLPALQRPFHARACLFAEAAECAGLQGRFWEMNDALFSVQETVKTEDVDPMDLAVRLGLNRSDFKHCLSSHATAARVASDIKEAIARNLTGTPSFLVNDKLFLGRIPRAELE